MDPIEGKAPVADWMSKYAPVNGCDCGCNCDPCDPCYPHPPFCPEEGDMDSDTMYQQMQYSISELERIIKPLDLPETTKFQIIHLATCNIRVCMNLLKLIQKNAADIAVLNEQMTTAKGVITTHEEKIVEIQGNISTIDTKIATLDQKHNNQQTQINENATAINELKAHKVSRCEFEKVAYSVIEHHKAIANLETQVTNNKVSVDNSMAELGKRVDKLVDKVQDLNGDVNALQAVVTPAKIAAIDEAITENAKGIELVKSACNNNREFIGKVAHKVDHMDDVLHKVMEDHKAFAGQIAANTAGVEGNRKNIVANTAAIETLQATDDAHGADIATLKVRVDRHDAEISQIKDDAIAGNTAINNRLVVLEQAKEKYEPMFLEDHSNLDAVEEKVNGIEARIEVAETKAENAFAATEAMKPVVDGNVEAIKKANETIAEVNANMATGFENINKNVADGFNTINGGIDNEIRPAITANTEKIAEHTAQIGDLQTRVDANAKAIANEAVVREEKDVAQDAELAKAVMYTDISDADNPNRRTIMLKNHDSISGLDTNGIGHNLVMLSKWNKADFGDGNVPANLNGTELTFNDDKTVVTQ